MLCKDYEAKIKSYLYKLETYMQNIDLVDNFEDFKRNKVI